MNETPPQPTEAVPAQAEAEESSRSSVALFIEQVGKLLPREIVESKIRATSDGLFLQEEVLDRLITTYQEWLVRESGGMVHKSTQKCVRRLFDADRPSYYYLIEGKQCLVGYLVPLQMESPQKLGVPVFRGSPLSTKDYLHPKDPLLTTHPNIEAQLRPEGLELTLTVRERKFRCTLATLKQFAQLAKQSRRLTEELGGYGESLREVVQAFMHMLGRCAPARPEQRMLVPYGPPQRKFELLSHGSFIVVLEQGGVIKDLYELDGRNLSEFLQREIPSLRRGRLPLENFQLGKHPDTVGTIKILDEIYSLDVRLLSDMLALVKRSSTLREAIKGHYTIVDVLKKLIALLQYSERSPDERGHHPRRRRGKHPAIRKRVNKEWTFLVRERNHIFRCFEGESHPRREHGGGHQQRDRRGPNDQRRGGRRRGDDRPGGKQPRGNGQRGPRDQ